MIDRTDGVSVCVLSRCAVCYDTAIDRRCVFWNFKGDKLGAVAGKPINTFVRLIIDYCNSSMY